MLRAALIAIIKTIKLNWMGRKKGIKKGDRNFFGRFQHRGSPNRTCLSENYKSFGGMTLSNNSQIECRGYFEGRALCRGGGGCNARILVTVKFYNVIIVCNECHDIPPVLMFVKMY